MATSDFNEMVHDINKKINSKDKMLARKGKIIKIFFIIILFYFSIFLTFSLINVTHHYFFKTPLIDLGTFNKSPTSDKIAKQFYRMLETGRIIRDVD
jgi:hypothetical protein